MEKVRWWLVDVVKTFPADRPVAKLMARAMVTWADAQLEFNGIGARREGKKGGYKAMDRFDPLYRRLYFWRGLTITLSSAQTTITNLTADPEFKSWLDAAPGLGKDYRKYKKSFDREMDKVKKIRNQVSAHIEEDVGDSLANLPVDAVGVLGENGPDVLSPRFAIEFILATLVPNHADATKRQEALDKLLEVVARAYEGMLNTLSVAILLYSQQYPLFQKDAEVGFDPERKNWR